jgi:hypothetical protein
VAAASVEISVPAWVQVLSAKASASAAEVLSTVQVLVLASAGGRAALWQVAECHWPEADWYPDGLASLEPVDLVLSSAAWLNLAVSALASLLDA